MSATPPGPPPPVPPVPPLVPVILPRDMPAAWLQQVKDAVKADQPSTLKTVLSSSLIAALIAAGTAIGTAYFTIKANSSLEQWKIEHAEQKEAQDGLKTAYNRLDEPLSQLLGDMKGASRLIQINQGNRRYAASIKSDLLNLGIDEGKVLALKTDPHLPSDIWRTVDPPLGELASVINQASAGSDASNFSAAEPRIERDLTLAINEVRRRKPR